VAPLAVRDLSSLLSGGWRQRQPRIVHAGTPRHARFVPSCPRLAGVL